MKLNEKIIRTAEWIVILFTGCVIAYISVLVFLYRFNTENSIPTLSAFFSAPLCLIFLFIITRLSVYFLPPPPRTNLLLSGGLLVLTLAFVGAVSLTYVSQTRLLPESDPKSCFDIALRFYQSDFSAVVPEGSYLSLWPFQTGFIFILEKTMRLFRNTSPLFFQQINCLYLLLTIASGYIIVCSITGRIAGRALYLLLMGSCFPLIFRVSEIYGNLPALALMMLSCMFFILFFRWNKNWQRLLSLLGFSVSAVAACIYKRNCLIYVIAFLLVSAVLQLHRFHAAFSAAIVVTALFCIFSTGFIQKYYEHYAGNVCGKGVPADAFLAMGLQYNGEEAIPGGWNGFHSDTYIATGYDYDKTVQISREAIRKSAEGFLNDPFSAADFFHTKVLKQWANQTHGTYWNIGNRYDPSRSPEDFWVKYLEGAKYRKLTSFEDIHESLLYAVLLGACLLLFGAKIKKENICFQYLLPAVTFIGGFLFSLIWEGQTGAVIYYPVLALPVAAGFLFRSTEAVLPKHRSGKTDRDK